MARCLSRGRGRAALPPARAASDAVAAREAGLRRLQRVAQAYAQAVQSWPEVRRELIDALMHVRVLSLDVVETIEAWRGAGRPGAVWPDPQTGENYLIKMKDDTRWLAESPLGELLRFSAKSDPFFVVPSTGGAPSTPTGSNQMTPTLQAQRRQVQCAAPGAPPDPRRAVLPLQNSLLRRIRAAELAILKESVQARLQSAAGSPTAPVGFAAPGALGAAASAAAAAEKLRSAPVPLPVDVAAAAAASYGQRHATEPSPKALPAPLVAPASPGTSAAPRFLPPATSAALAPPRPRPPRPREVLDGAFTLWPVSATTATAGEAFQSYVGRVEAKVMRSQEPLSGLEEALKDEGLGAPEWFWLTKRSGKAGAPCPETADGLVVFRLQRKSITYGEILHISVVPGNALEEAIDLVKQRMFGWLPIKCIRTTLWFCEVDGELQMNKELKAVFQGRRFRWFQQINANGMRREVLNCPRVEPDDPAAPVEEPALEFCLGQAWLRGCAGPGLGLPVDATRKLGRCPWSLVLAAACLRHIWGRDADVQRAKDGGADPTLKAPAAARQAVREGLLRGILSGDLDNMLAQCKPVGTITEDHAVAGGVLTPTALALNLARVLEAGPPARSVPGTLMDASDDAAGTLRAALSAPGYAEAAAELGLEGLPSAVASLSPRDVAVGRLFVALDWLGVRALDSGGFEVPVHAAGSCRSHPHPVLYVATSEDEYFVVIIPWETAGLPPNEEALFAACTGIIRATQPMETPPYAALRFDAPFDVRYASRLVELEDPESLGVPPQPGQPSGTHLAEWSSVSVGVGRPAPGRLPRPAGAEGLVLGLRRPFALCLFHTDVDDLNAPLAATLVA